MAKPRSMSRAFGMASVAVVVSVATSAQAAVFTSWGTVTGSSGNYSGTGTLGSVTVTYTNNNTSGSSPYSTTDDLSDATIYSQPGSANESVLVNQNGGGIYPFATNTVTFSSGVNNLALYFLGWRAGDTSTPTTPGTYELNAYDSGNNLLAYSFLSGSYGSTAPTITNNQFTFTDMFTGGIIAFTGAVSRVEWFVTGTVGGGNGVTTFGILSSAVPGSGVAAIGSLGLAGLARRRRR